MNERIGLKLVQEPGTPHESDEVSEMYAALVQLAAAPDREEFQSLLTEIWIKYSHNRPVLFEIEKIIIARYGEAWFTFTVLCLEHFAQLARDAKRAERLQKFRLVKLDLEH